jgi:hypothetical protein
MVVAYINFNGLHQSDLGVSRIIIGFLEFYGNSFDQDKMGIFVLNGK